MAQDSRFRPRLDDLGAWETLSLKPEETARIEALQSQAAEAAAARLHDDFGPAGVQFGAEAFARRLGALPIDEEGAFVLAKTAAAIDYFAARAAPPRPAIGGLTNPGNRVRWSRLRDHLARRLLHALSQETSQSIYWRSVFGRVLNVPVSVPLLQKSIAADLSRIAPFVSVEVELDLGPETPGGLRWLAMQNYQALAQLKAALRRREPSLVELLRDAEAPPTAADFVVVYSCATDAAGDLILRCYDARRGVGVSIRCKGSGEHLRFSERPEQEAGASIKALRVWTLRPVTPPHFGARRYLFWLLPWRLFWWIRRWFALRFGQDNPLLAPSNR